MPSAFYEDWFTFGATRDRLSFLFGGIILTITIPLVGYIVSVFLISSIGQMLFAYALIGLATVLAIIPMMIQRIRSMTGNHTGWILVIFALCIIIPFFSILLLIWPPKNPKGKNTWW